MSRFDEISKYIWKDGDGPDDITKMLFSSWDDLFSMSEEDVQAFHLEAARRRFADLSPHVKALAQQAEAAGVTEINSYEDLVPLLFQHTQYKSYPISFVEKGRWDMLTKWLDGFTTVDLSQVDASQCRGMDEWLDLIEAESTLRPFHTSGTGGKFSFIPRTGVEANLFSLSMIKSCEPFGDEPGVELGFDQARLPAIYPSVRYGRYSAQRIVAFLSEFLTPSPEQMYTLNNSTLSTDLVSLSGRVRVAQAKGELHKIQLNDSQRFAFRRYLDELERRPQETDEFMQRMMDELHGQVVFCVSQTSYLAQVAEDGLKRGIRNVFGEGSVGIFGGGAKGVTLPDNYLEKIYEFTGHRQWSLAYGMTELVGVSPLCPEGYYHVPAYHIPFLLDPDTGAMLPRSGQQTGRYAGLDLLTSSHWGGIVTGDKVTMEWDRDCPCGRSGVHIHDTITRYSESTTGDDRVLCSATVDNTDSALQELLAV